MPRISKWVWLLLFCSAPLPAQVLAPTEIKDPELRSLQGRYMDDLKKAGKEVLDLKFDYPFYLSRKLDIDEQQQQREEQRSIRFDRYQGNTVLEITGNYYAAYSSTQMSPEERAHQTFMNVVLPLLKAVVPPFQGNSSVQSYAFEISHHLLGKVMGVSMERPENLVVVLPQKAAIRLLGARDEDTRQAALLEASVFLNAQPVTLWLKGTGPQRASAQEPPAATAEQSSSGNQASAEGVGGGHGDQSAAAAPPATPAAQLSQPSVPVRDTSPAALASLQSSAQDLFARMVKELDSQAHFVSYASPSFVAFRRGIYLEISITTALHETAGSRYRLAALAFDDHVAHLLRPVLAYFKDDPKFDGIGFSTTVHLPGKPAANATPEAVEFFFPFPALRCYEQYDCTGQQLLDASTMLINGERVSLDLQVAEGGEVR